MTVPSPSLSAAQLAACQAIANSAADQTITIARSTTGADGYGHDTETYATVATVQGYVGTPTASMLQNYEYLVGAVTSWLVSVPVGTDLRAKDQITVGGQTLLVQTVMQPEGLQVMLQALAAEIKG